MPYLPPLNHERVTPLSWSPTEKFNSTITPTTSFKQPANLSSSSSSIYRHERDSGKAMVSDTWGTPRCIRKMSGELVRPALCLSSRRRRSSMPPRLTSCKAVHFSSHLEHIRHFIEFDCPQTISSPTVSIFHDQYEKECHDSQADDQSDTPSHWEINAENFSQNKSSPNEAVYIQEIWISRGDPILQGSIMVQNIAFQKSVVCRFTWDRWETISEVRAEYGPDLSMSIDPPGYDRFIFSIQIPNSKRLASKTIILCIRYEVNGQTFWSNNEGQNFQIKFRKKPLPQSAYEPSSKSRDNVTEKLLLSSFPSIGISRLASRYDLEASLLVAVRNKSRSRKLPANANRGSSKILNF